MLSVLSEDGRDRPGILTDDGLKRNFYQNVKMRRNERSAAVNNGATVGLEGVSRVVELNVKADFYEEGRQPVDQQLDGRIVDY